MEKEYILITGGTGYIGSRLLDSLIQKGYKIICIIREQSSFNRVKRLYDDVVWINNATDQIIAAFENYNIVGIIHCATAYGRKDGDIYNVFHSNVDFPLFLLQTGEKYKIHYFINTDTFFTRLLGDAWQEMHIVYMNAYTKSKFVFREIARDNIRNMDMVFINLELQHVYGREDDEGKFITYLVGQLKKNVPTIELTEGLQGRDWTYVDDVVGAYLAILQNLDKFDNRHFYEFEVGTGIVTTLREFCIKVKEASGASSLLGFGMREMQPNELMRSVADNSALRALGWEPKVDLDEGIRRLFSNENSIGGNTNI